MPRKYTKKRAYRRKRAPFRRKKRKYQAGSRYAIYKRPSSGNQITLTLKAIDVPLLTNDSLIDQFWRYEFDLSKCYSHGDWRNLYDQYRINWVRIVAVPISTTVLNKPFDDNSGSGTTVPQICYAIDRDDITQPANWDALKNRGNSRMLPATKRWTLTFRPTPLSMVYLTSTTTAYAVDSSRRFYDAGNETIPMYGLKIGMESASPSQAFGYHLYMTYSVTFKNRRK